MELLYILYILWALGAVLGLNWARCVRCGPVPIVLALFWPVPAALALAWIVLLIALSILILATASLADMLRALRERLL